MQIIRKFILRGTLFFGIILCLGATAFTGKSMEQNQVETIVFMRHGERHPSVLGQLNCKGLNRALALPKVIVKKFGKPDYIFAPNPYAKISAKDGFYYYVTGLISVQPLAIQLDMPVDVLYSFWQIKKTINAITAEKYHKSLLFISWEHLSIVSITKKLIEMYGTDHSKIIIPSWPKDDFDSLYVITIDWNKKPPKISFIHDHEGLDNGSEDCPTPKHLKAMNGSHSNDSHSIVTYILIPEGEAARGGIDQLSCKGLNRSLALPDRLYWLYPAIDKFILPVPNGRPNKALQPVMHFFLRAMTTLEPTAINAKKDFSVLYPNDIPFVIEHLKQLTHHAKTIAIAWPNDDLANLAQAIFAANGGDPKIIPNPIRDIDTMYKIQVFEKSRIPLFTRIKENLNGVSNICP